jgi:hypothetical protein
MRGPEGRSWVPADSPSWYSRFGTSHWLNYQLSPSKKAPKDQSIRLLLYEPHWQCLRVVDYCGSIFIATAASLANVIFKRQHREIGPPCSHSSTLLGTHNGHFEVASRQDVKHTIILALAPVFASLFRSKMIDRGRLREATAELACLLGRRKRAYLLGMLRETSGMEEAGLSIENLPFLTESIHIVNDRFTVTRNHVAHSEIAHEASAIAKVLALALLNQDRNKVLVGLLGRWLL